LSIAKLKVSIYDSWTVVAVHGCIVVYLNKLSSTVCVIVSVAKCAPACMWYFISDEKDILGSATLS